MGAAAPRPGAVLLRPGRPAGRRAPRSIVADVDDHLVAITTDFAGQTSWCSARSTGRATSSSWCAARLAGWRSTARTASPASGSTPKRRLRRRAVLLCVAASRPLVEIAPGAGARALPLGIGNLRLRVDRRESRATARLAVPHALVQQKQAAGLYSAECGTIILPRRAAVPRHRCTSRQRADRRLPGAGLPGARRRRRRRARRRRWSSARSGSAPRSVRFRHSGEAAVYGACGRQSRVVAGWLASLAFRKRV